MTSEELFNLFEEKQARKLVWTGDCHDCNEPVEVTAEVSAGDGSVSVTGGSVVRPKGMSKFFFKCSGCYQKDPVLRNYQPCEVYSRVVGYLRPVQQWNEGKKAEYKERKLFKVIDG